MGFRKSSTLIQLAKKFNGLCVFLCPFLPDALYPSCAVNERYKVEELPLKTRIFARISFLIQDFFLLWG